MHAPMQMAQLGRSNGRAGPLKSNVLLRIGIKIYGGEVLNDGSCEF